MNHKELAIAIGIIVGFIVCVPFIVGYWDWAHELVDEWLRKKRMERK